MRSVSDNGHGPVGLHMCKKGAGRRDLVPGQPVPAHGVALRARKWLHRYGDRRHQGDPRMMTAVCIVNAPERFHGYLRSLMMNVHPNLYVSTSLDKAARGRVW